MIVTGIDWTSAFARERLRLKAFFQRRIPDTSLVDDLIGATFERALRNQGRLRNNDSLSAWLFRIGRRLVADEYRRRPDMVRLTESHTDPAARPEVIAIDRERHRALNSALRRLQPRERKILQLKFGESRSNHEIAQMLGLTEANVAKIVYRSLIKLRKDASIGDLP